KALDLLRGLLPAASLSHMGIFATGQTYENLILHLLAHPLPEARGYGGMILEAVQAVMPSFVSRVERPERGGEWIAYLQRRDLVGERANRRHRPGRGFETLRYRFEIVSDYGAFRDLQRHRMLTCQWQRLSPDLGADVPEEVEAAGVGDDYRRALEVSRSAYESLVGAGLERSAPYALCLA